MGILKMFVILFITSIITLLIFYPFQLKFVFTETRTNNPALHYVSVREDRTFRIRYTHSIHKTDVIETYKISNKSRIQLITMEYTNLAIGLPGYAEEGQTFEDKDGKYILTYKNNFIDSFTMLIGNIDMDLAFQYEGNEIDLKQALIRGKSYKFEVKKMSIYQQMKGVDIND